jgi:hypothetical protein
VRASEREDRNKHSNTIGIGRMMMTQVVTYLSHHFWSIECDIAVIIVFIYTFWLVGGGRNSSGGSKGDDISLLLLMT